jgi:hypothetical protein
MEALKAIKEAIDKALAVASDMARCLEALGVRLSADLLQLSAWRTADLLQPSATSPSDGGSVEGVDMGGWVGEVKAGAEPTAAPLSAPPTSVAEDTSAEEKKSEGREGGASAIDEEEARAWKELEKFIQEHLPEGSHV